MAPRREAFAKTAGYVRPDITIPVVPAPGLLLAGAACGPCDVVSTHAHDPSPLGPAYVLGTRRVVTEGKVWQSMRRMANLPAAGPERLPCTRADAIIEAIVTLTARDGRPPSYKEIMAAVGLRSRRLCYREIDRLVDYGRLRRLPGARGLIVPPGGSAPSAE